MMNKTTVRQALKPVFVWLLGAFPLAGWAAFPETAPEPFPQSELEDTASIRSSGHLVLFSPVREVRGEIRSETMARLPVEGEGRLYEIERDSDREKARDYYLKLLQAGGGQVLFECTGIACGRSNVWANQIFGQRKLYGRDANQDYLVAGTTAADGRRWLTLVYTVTRGNLREYIWVEHLEVTASVAIPGLGNLDRRIQGPVVVPWSGGVTHRFDWSANDRRRVADWARADSSTVVLTGFSSLNVGETFDEALERAERAVSSLSDVLAKTGVPTQQQRTLIVGPAVPFADPDRQGNRVEITVITQ
ncbi:DUF4892 domain-containing protein [Marinobacter salinisoli]|uniref:DUF4892 domain-containing protein n=1 Tax=Marinobacter salinisoli TaxID=2769486 RepID=A0ABX7MNP8_9GAMM|nr:DUF4892 domain-containing protein [Marinobacter salinisoli]QSP93739.1 DUF4892 domain-containing protein [Marinobacter salinisoli]